MPLAQGTRLGPYAIEAPLGAGGMGQVYAAADTLVLDWQDEPGPAPRPQ